MTRRSDTFAFSAGGSPASQGSLSAHVVRGRVRVHNASPKTAAWRTVVTAAALTARARGWTPFDCPVRVDLEFYMPPPKRPRFRRPATKPDADKLVRAVLDGITDAAVWADDSRVVEIHVRQWYADEMNPPGVIVEVSAL